MDSQPPASDAQWRTICRTCGSSFKSRNQLMRHLYRTHPGKPGKPKATQKTPNPVQPPSPPKPATSNPERSSSQVHPFLVLSEQQRAVYVARVLSAIFAVCMKQMEEDKERQQGQEGHQKQDEERHQKTRQRPFNDDSTLNLDSLPPDSNLSPKGQPIPDQTYQGKLGGGPELEDSDDDNGGVALFGPTLGRLPLRLQDRYRGVDGLEGDIDLD